LQSRDLDPLLHDDDLDDDDDDEERCPQDRLAGHGRGGGRSIFRTKVYSPIIGTPPRWAAARTTHSNDAADNNESRGEDGSAWIPSIRPSLSCPTSVFESPLFPSNNGLGLGGVGGVGSGRSTLLLSQPYPLEKIVSASAERSPSEDNGPDDDKLLGDENGLETADISVIECDDDDSPFHVPSAMEMEQRVDVADDGNTMRNLSDAFEMLVTNDGAKGIETVTNLEKHLEGLTAPSHGKKYGECESRRSGETDSTTKPSPTSVLGFDDDAGSPSSTSNLEVPTMQLENGLTVASVSMPHFGLHDSLRGNLCQGLVDRVSFYSVVRDINKEAADAASSDPKAGVYNDGSVHGKSQPQAPSVTGSGVNGAPAGATGNASATLPNANGKHQVVAEDGRVHVHPDPKEERRSILVMASRSDERNNPNEGPSDPTYDADGANSGNNGVAGEAFAFPSLGAALLDEEWWLMSAIASRTPEEVSVNQSSKLLPTFYEAMGEKDAAAAGVAGAAGEAGAAAQQSSRTQLWKPGRSWWEAKSGKNPWVEPVVHNNRWRYLWPLIHYHKFIAKCIKKLKRNGIDVKSCTSAVSLFLRQEVCNVSDHLAFMSKYDSEEWTSALSHFDGWTDHDPAVEGALRNLVASQRMVGVSETASDLRSSLLRSQIDDAVLRAMQAAKEEAGRDAYEYKDVPAQHLAKMEDSAGGGSSGPHPPHPMQDHSFSSRVPNRSMAWANESHLRLAIESKKRTINDTSWSNRSGFHGHPLPPYPHPDMYGRQFEGHPPYGPASGYGPSYGGPMNSQYYPPHPHPPPYDGYHGQYPPPPHHPMGYHHHPGDMSYSDQFGHHHQYYNGYYHPADGSFHEGMVFADNSIHSQDPYMHSSSMAQTPSRYPVGGDLSHHHGQYPVSPYWGHLNISQLPGLAASPNTTVTPSKPPRGNGHPNRSFRNKRSQQPQGQQGKPAKSLIMFPNQTNSPASRFVMSPQDKSNPYYTTNQRVPSDGHVAQPSSLNQSAGPEESFVLPTIEDYSPESPADKAAGHASNTSMDLMPPSVKKMYLGSRRQDGGALSEVSENP